MQTHKLPILLSRNTVKHAVGYSNAGYDINRRVNRHTGAHPNTNNTGTEHTDTQPYAEKHPAAYMHGYKAQAQARKPNLTLPVAFKPTITCSNKALKTAAFIYFATITINFVILQ
jgi:hypothetical protein